MVINFEEAKGLAEFLSGEDVGKDLKLKASEQKLELMKRSLKHNCWFHVVLGLLAVTLLFRSCSEELYLVGTSLY